MHISVVILISLFSPVNLHSKSNAPPPGIPAKDTEPCPQYTSANVFSKVLLLAIVQNGEPSFSRNMYPNFLRLAVGQSYSEPDIAVSSDFPPAREANLLFANVTKYKIARTWAL
jgi:hypothetical protein